MTTVRADWDDDTHQIIRYVFEPHWDWDDFFAAVREARALMDSAPGNVGVIFDASDTPNINVPQNAPLWTTERAGTAAPQRGCPSTTLMPEAPAGACGPRCGSRWPLALIPLGAVPLPKVHRAAQDSTLGTPTSSSAKRSRWQA